MQKVKIRCVDRVIEVDKVVLRHSTILREFIASDAYCICKDIDVILLNTKSMDVKNALGDLILGQRELNFESKGVLKRLGINIENMDKMAAALGNVNNNGSLTDSRISCQLCFQQFPVDRDLIEHLQRFHGIKQCKVRKIPKQTSFHRETSICPPVEHFSSSCVRETTTEVCQGERNEVLGSPVDKSQNFLAEKSYEETTQSMDLDIDSFTDSDVDGYEQESSDPEDVEKTTAGFACFKCSKTALSATHLKWHLAWVHFKKEIMLKFGFSRSSRECPTCFVPFSHSMMILRHLTSKHNALDGIIARAHMDKMINTYRGQKCHVCFLKFSIAFDLAEHLLIVHGIKNNKAIHAHSEISVVQELKSGCSNEGQGKVSKADTTVPFYAKQENEINLEYINNKPYSEKSFEEETSSQSTDITNESFSDPDERRYEPDSSDVGNEPGGEKGAKPTLKQLGTPVHSQQCFICNKVFKSVSVLNNHLTLYHFRKQIKMKSYKCTRECPKYYLTGTDKIFHLAFTHRILKSCIPAKHFVESGSLKKTNHHSELTQGSRCQYCTKVFPGRLGSHPLYCKTKLLSKSVTQTTPSGFGCSKCSKVAQSLTHLKWHLAWSHFKREIMEKFGIAKSSRVCSVCFKPVAHSMMMFRHLASKHNALDGVISKDDMERMFLASSN